MANYFTHISFKLAVTREEAEQLVSVIASAASIEDGNGPMLAPEIEKAFRTDSQSPDQNFCEIMDDLIFGIECIYNETSSTLTIFDSDGAPNLSALGQCLQRLYPEKLPLGFVYADTCDKARAGGFGGGYFVITGDTISQQTLAHMLDNDLTALAETSGVS